MIYRIIHTRIWADPKFIQLSPEQKLLFLCALGNEHVNYCGIYEIDLSVMANKIGLVESAFRSAFEAMLLRFPTMLHYDYDTSEIAILNFAKHNLKELGAKAAKYFDRDLAEVKSAKLCFMVYKTLVGNQEIRQKYLSHGRKINARSGQFTPSEDQSKRPFEAEKEPTGSPIEHHGITPATSSLSNSYPLKENKVNNNNKEGEKSSTISSVLFPLGIKKIGTYTMRELFKLSEDDIRVQFPILASYLQNTNEGYYSLVKRIGRQAQFIETSFASILCRRMDITEIFIEFLEFINSTNKPFREQKGMLEFYKSLYDFEIEYINQRFEKARKDRLGSLYLEDNYKRRIETKKSISIKNQ